MPIPPKKRYVIPKGTTPNPHGRPKLNPQGRVCCVETLDKMLSRLANQRLLLTAFEKELKSDPIGFFKTFVMPLLPKGAALTFLNPKTVPQNQKKVPWAPLLDTPHTSPNEESTPPDDDSASGPS